MGTTMAFYYIKNRSFDREWIQSIMERCFTLRCGETYVEMVFERMCAALGAKSAQKWKEDFLRDCAELEKDASGHQQPKLPSPMVAYRPDAPWLPFFDVHICEGWTASSKDARFLSEKFWTPVLACSIADSDILFVSYCDATKNIAYDCAKPNYEELAEMGEYDTGFYRAEFPRFLMGFCPETSEEALQEIWDGDEFLADYRLFKLCDTLHLGPLLYLHSKVPEGFEAITPPA